MDAAFGTPGRCRTHRVEGMAELAACRGPGWIPYRRADEILHVFERILAANGAASRDRYILAGPPNNGKTALIDRLLARHPPSLNASGTNTRYPVFCPEAPPAPIFRRWFHSAIRKIGGLPVTCPDAEAIRYLGETLRAIETRLIVLDEAQRLGAGAIHQREEFLSSLAQVALRAKAGIVLVGTGDILKLASAAEHFTLLSLPAWPIDDEFRGMAGGLESGLSPKQPIGAAAQATRLHSLCEGLLGELVTILTSLGSHVPPFREALSLTENLDLWVPPSKRFERAYESL